MSLLRNFATVGSGTAMSRVLGFVRDIFIATALGTGPVAEAYFVAQRLPNLFRRIFAEGGFASAFVPLFTRTRQAEGSVAAQRFAEESLAGLIAALIVFTIVAELAMTWLTFALAPGFASDPEKFDIAVLLSRIAFPYLLLISIVTLLSGVLNGVGRFAAAAFSTVLLNLVLIAALLFIYWTGEIATLEAGIILSAAVVVGGILQLVVLFIACARAGIGLRLRLPRLTPGVKRLTRLAVPSVVAGGVVQINIVVGTIIASMQAGAVSWLYYADRLYQLPLGIVGIAIGVVLLPDLARALQAGQEDEVARVQNRAFEFAAALTLPASVALAVIPAPILAVLFEHGAFTAADTAATAPALALYALGLPAFVAIKVLQPAYFAREDTRTPMIYGAISVAVNILASLLLFQLFGYLGIAAGTAIASWLNTAMLAWTLRRRGQFVPDALFRRRLPMLALAAALMGAALYLLAWLIEPWLRDPNLLIEVGALIVLVLAGLVLFALLCHLTGAVDGGRVMAVLRRRRA
jgi:putative peptidoglycan lipid II flippase